MQNGGASGTLNNPQASRRERVGLIVSGGDARALVAGIVAAEKAGVRQIWTTQAATTPDALTIFAAAAAQTSRIRLGTAIVPTYPRHPLVLAQQALAIDDLAPGRLRIGVGPSHARTIEGIYGIPMGVPLEHLREYVSMARALLWEGKVDHQGYLYQIRAQLPRVPRTPILISALGEGAFRLAGEITDGALTWVCPVPYLLEKALPAVRRGAEKSGRPAPPLLAHVSVALSQDRQAVLAAGRKHLSGYSKVAFFAQMFADAGFPVSPNGEVSDALIDNLIISGDEATVRARLIELLEKGLDELLVMSIPIVDADREQAQLAQFIGTL